MTAANGEQVTLPPRPLVRIFWSLHRAAYRLTGGRFGLQRPERGARFGMLRLHTVGRRSGQERIAMIGYFEDGLNLVTHPISRFRTFPAWLPIGALDKAFIRGPVLVRAAHVVRTKLSHRASDHLPLVVDFHLAE